jgi:hypothetical protein
MVCGEDVLNICWVTCHEESRAAWTSLHLEVAPSCSKDGSEVVMEVAEIEGSIPNIGQSMGSKGFSDPLDFIMYK